MLYGHSRAAHIRAVYTRTCAIACRFALPFRGSGAQVRETYRGGGALWLSLGPTAAVEDGVTRALMQRLGAEVSTRSTGYSPGTRRRCSPDTPRALEWGPLGYSRVPR